MRNLFCDNLKKENCCSFHIEEKLGFALLVFKEKIVFALLHSDYSVSVNLTLTQLCDMKERASLGRPIEKSNKDSPNRFFFTIEGNLTHFCQIIRNACRGKLDCVEIFPFSY